MRAAPDIVLVDEERAELERLIRSGRTSVRLVQRACIVTLAAAGKQNKEIAIASALGRVQSAVGACVTVQNDWQASNAICASRTTTSRGCGAVDGIDHTEQSRSCSNYWSTRTMAAKLGVSTASVSRHWRANGLKPHLVHGFKVARDSKFVGKLEARLGLYMSPPEHAPVLRCDEKSGAGLRSHATRVAAEERPCGDHDGRLQTP